MRIRIQARRTNLEKFSSFLALYESDENLLVMRWQSSGKLKHNFNEVINKLENESDEKLWFFYWLQLLEEKNDTLAKQHLVAYLEESCYWAAQKISSLITLPNLSTTDLFFKAFRLAQDKTNDLKELLKAFIRFNPSQSSLRTYSEQWLEGVIKDSIYAQYRTGKHSNWGLLKNASKKGLKEALSNQGFDEKKTQSISYCLVWHCFKSVYTTGDKQNPRKNSEPTPEEIEEIIDLYNQRRTDYPMITENLSEREYKKAMETCLKAIKEYETSKCILNVSTSLSEYESETSDSWQYKPITKALSVTPNSRINESEELPIAKEQIYSFLAEEFQLLTPEEKKLINLNHALNLNQSEIAQKLELEQYQISRNLKKINKNLFDKVLNRVKTINQEVSWNSYNLKIIYEIIELWLKYYSKKRLHCLFIKNFKGLSADKQKLLRLYYGGDYDNSTPEKTKVSESLGLAPEMTDLLLDKILHHFYAQVQDYSLTNFEISLEPQQKKIKVLAEEWLKEKALYSILLKP